MVGVFLFGGMEEFVRYGGYVTGDFQRCFASMWMFDAGKLYVASSDRVRARFCIYALSKILHQ